MLLPQHHEQLTALYLGQYAAAARKKRVAFAIKIMAARNLSCVAQQRDDMCVCACAAPHVFRGREAGLCSF